MAASNEAAEPAPLPEPDRWLALWTHRPALYRIARRRLSDPLEAEDVVNEAMLRAAVRPELEDPGAWMARVVVNLCTDRRRAEAGCAARFRYWATYAIPTESPEHTVCDRLDAHRLLTVTLPSLPATQRRVIELRSLGLDVAGIATTLGMTYKATESALSRARARLRSAAPGVVPMVGLLRRGGWRVAIGSTVAASVASLTLAPPVPPPAPRAPAVRAAPAPAMPKVVKAARPVAPRPVPVRASRSGRRPAPAPASPVETKVVRGVPAHPDELVVIGPGAIVLCVRDAACVAVDRDAVPVP